jgi:hypothetical protein
MRYMANSRMGNGVTPEQLTQFFEENSFSSEGWEFVRHRVVTEYAVKVGDKPGVVLFMDVDSPEEAADVVNALPVVRHGLLTFELDPLGPAMRF